MKNSLLPAAAFVGLLALSAVTTSCKPDEKECDTAMQDSLNVREMRLKEREMALREREMTIIERERALGISGSNSFSGSTAGSISAAAAGNPQSTVKNGLKPGSNDPRGVAYKRPVLSFPGQYPESSERLLTEADVEHQTAWGMRVMMNEIYARHGYIFPDADLRKHFADESWYKGTQKSMGKIKLTATEIQNIAFIRKHQPTSKH